MWYTRLERSNDMYISIKAARIIAAILLALIFYAEYAISQNEDIPDSVKRKISNVLFIVVLIGIAIAACYGPISDE